MAGIPDAVVENFGTEFEAHDAYSKALKDGRVTRVTVVMTRQPLSPEVDEKDGGSKQKEQAGI